MPFYLSDTEWVIVVLAAIYLFECFFWVRRESICLSSLMGSFRVLPSPTFMGNERNKLVLGFPSPLARSFVTEAWPFAISPEGILLNDLMMEAGHVKPRLIGFDVIASGMTLVDKELRAQAGTIAHCSSPDQTQRLAYMLAEVAGTSEAERGNVIGKHLDHLTNHTEAEERLAELTILGGSLRWSAFMLFVMAFVVGPSLYFVPRHVPWLSVVMYFSMTFALWMTTVWDYNSCRKRLLGEKFSDRFRHTGMLFVSPATTMRSPEALFRHGLSAYHPLTVVAILCSKARFIELARSTLLALEYPCPSELSSDPTVERIGTWYRTKLLKRLNTLLRHYEIDVAALLQPPDPLADSRSYCPRCHNQFVHDEGMCSDCGGMPLVAYEVKASYGLT